MAQHYDAIVVGGGHNGLTCAAYLAKAGLHLPFAILSDDRLELMHALNLPTFEVNGLILHKRFTLIIREGKIEHVFYPVFPPDGHAEQVLNWLKTNPA